MTYILTLLFVIKDGMCGYLKIYYGPMFARKTTSIFGDLEIYVRLQKRVLYINHSLDTRGEHFSSHGIIRPVEGIMFYKTNTLTIIEESFLNFDVIAIDEAQFFQDLVLVLSLVKRYPITFIVGGLILNSEGQIFGQIDRLIPFADEVIQLFSLCSVCASYGQRKNAIFSYKQGKRQEISVGNDYVPLCRDCYERKTRIQEENLTALPSSQPIIVNIPSSASEPGLRVVKIQNVD